MDLHEEFDRHARERVSESGARLRGADVRSRLESRVTRGRRVRSATVGAGSVAAVGVLAVGAMMVPRLGLPGIGMSGSAADSAVGPATSSAGYSPPPSPSMNSEASAPAVEESNLPGLGTDGYLDNGYELWNSPGPLSCDGLASAEPPAGTVFTLDHPQIPIPTWIETGRLYGWGDDVLVSGYPIPLAASAQSDFDAVQVLVSDFAGGPAELVLTSPDGTVWGFAVSWSERDDLPHDAPGAFVALSADYECNDGVPPVGTYDARLAFTAGDGSTQVITLDPIAVVDGVPSLPEVDTAGR